MNLGNDWWFSTAQQYATLLELSSRRDHMSVKLDKTSTLEYPVGHRTPAIDSQQGSRGRYGRHYQEGSDAGSVVSAGAADGPELQRSAPRVLVSRSRGRYERLYAAGSNLRVARCHW